MKDEQLVEEVIADVVNNEKKMGQYARAEIPYSEFIKVAIQAGIKIGRQEVIKEIERMAHYSKGDTDNSFQETGGDTNNNYQETGGDTNNSCQETGGEWFCGRVTLKKYPNTTKLLKEIKDSWDLTLPELCRWIAEHPKEALKILGKEGKEVKP